MFKIIESLSLDPIRLPISKTHSFFRPGFICRIVSDSTSDVCCDLSDGKSVFGIFGETFNHVTKVADDAYTMYSVPFVNVYTQRMIFRTNEYMFGDYYRGGSKLYVNNRGLFTAQEPYKDAVYYGRVISPPSYKSQLMEALFL